MSPVGFFRDSQNLPQIKGVFNYKTVNKRSEKYKNVRFHHPVTHQCFFAQPNRWISGTSTCQGEAGQSGVAGGRLPWYGWFFVFNQNADHKNVGNFGSGVLTVPTNKITNKKKASAFCWGQLKKLLLPIPGTSRN